MTRATIKALRWLALLRAVALVFLACNIGLWLGDALVLLRFDCCKEVVSRGCFGIA